MTFVRATRATDGWTFCEPPTARRWPGSRRRTGCGVCRCPRPVNSPAGPTVAPSRFGMSPTNPWFRPSASRRGCRTERSGAPANQRSWLRRRGRRSTSSTCNRASNLLQRVTRHPGLRCDGALRLGFLVRRELVRLKGGRRKGAGLENDGLAAVRRLRAKSVQSSFEEGPASGDSSERSGAPHAKRRLQWTERLGSRQLGIQDPLERARAA